MPVHVVYDHEKEENKEGAIIEKEKKDEDEEVKNMKEVKKVQETRGKRRANIRCSRALLSQRTQPPRSQPPWPPYACACWKPCRGTILS
mgnify:CR=1 FL=1